MTSATTMQELILLINCFFHRDVSFPSFNNMICSCSLAAMTTDDNEEIERCGSSVQSDSIAVADLSLDALAGIPNLVRIPALETLSSELK